MDIPHERITDLERSVVQVYLDRDESRLDSGQILELLFRAVNRREQGQLQMRSRARVSR